MNEVKRIANANNRRNALYSKDGYLCDRKGSFIYNIGRRIKVTKEGLIQ